MLQENSMRAPSYFYSVEHPSSRKSFFNVFSLLSGKPPYMDDNGLPGDVIVFTSFTADLILIKLKTSSAMGPCHE